MRDWALQGPRDNYEPDALREPEVESAVEEDDFDGGPDFDFAAAFDAAEKTSAPLHKFSSAVLHTVENTAMTMQHTAAEALHGAKQTAETTATTMQHTAAEALHGAKHTAEALYVAKDAFLTVMHDSKVISDATIAVGGIAASGALHVAGTAAAGATAAVGETVSAVSAVGAHVGTSIGAAAAETGAMAGYQPPEGKKLTPEELVAESKRFRLSLAE